MQIVQSVLIPKNKFSLQEAQKWLINNGFTVKKVDVTENNYRFRQHQPNKQKKYFIKTLDNDIKLVIMK